VPTSTCLTGVRDSSNLPLSDTAGVGIQQFLRMFKTADPSVLTWNSGPPPAPMLTARREFGAVTVNGVYYAVGGIKTDNTVTDVLEKYDPVTNVWSVLARMPAARHAPAVAAYGTRIFVFGGGTGTMAGWSQNVYIYNTSNDTWTTGPNMPRARGYVAAAELNGRIYLAGGTCQVSCSFGNQPLTLVEVYTPNSTTGTWTATNGTGVAQLTVARDSHTLTAANGRLWAVGGSGAAGNAMEYFTPNTGNGTWTSSHNASYAVTNAAMVLPSGRSLHGAGVMNGYLYIVGGLQAGLGPTNTVYAYDPIALGAGSWSTLTPMPTARHAFGGSVGIVINGNPPVTRFIVAGGSLTTSGGITDTVDSGAGG